MLIKIYSEVKQAIRNMRASKLRSALAALGILIGSASVVAMVSGGMMATREALLQLKGLGINLAAVSIQSPEKDKARVKQVTLSVAENLKNVSSDIIDLAPYTQLSANAYANDRNIPAEIIGATDALARLLDLKISQGRFLTHWDQYDEFCIIGDDIYQKIVTFMPQPVGKQIRVGNEIFTIAGILKPWDQSFLMYSDINDAIILPLHLSSLLDNQSQISNIILHIRPNTNLDLLQKQIQDYFKQEINNDNVLFSNAKQIIQGLKKQQDILTVFLGFIGAISLLVGGIGVMNIMLVSVMERRREIGIRLAVGAKPKDIQLLFLIESMILSLFGGIVGVFLGVFVTFAVAVFRHWHFTIFLTPIFIGFFVSATVGIFFGYYPAYKASKLKPIETLRAE